MTTYVLGAGASRHAGYPLAASMGTQLFEWMRSHRSQAFDYPAVVEFLQRTFGNIENIEDLLTNIHKLIAEYKNGTPDQRAVRSVLANETRPAIIQAVREWFTEIRQNKTEAYECFANELIEAGDCIISFNYDVSLEHELRRAGKWRIGDGYGFTIPEFPSDSPVKLLKLHGSINWLALMFGGITGALQIQPGNVFGLRPVLGSNELAFLGYPDLTDPSFRHPGAAIPTMIMPTRSKEFFFDTNLGREWEGFWDRLWQQAADALKGSDVVVLCGYSLPPADQRARDLLAVRTLTQSSINTRISDTRRRILHSTVSLRIGYPVNAGVPRHNRDPSLRSGFQKNYSGIFPCFLGGFLSRLVCSISSASINFLRVSRGWITAST